MFQNKNEIIEGKKKFDNFILLFFPTLNFII